ncbi:MAG: type II secretion system F family protein [Lachnospiraceae bacterium]|nr:type II secretion system F family protein [Lachnospiraceae bacterium]
MIQAVVMSGLCLVFFIYWGKHKKWSIAGTDKKIIFLLLGIEIVGSMLSIKQWYAANPGFDGILFRRELGKGSYVEELELKSDVYKGTVELEIEEKQPTKNEAKKLLEKAKEEIDATFLGENKALEQVMSDVILQDAYQDGMVAAEWSFDDYTYIGTDGVIKENELDEPELVEATAVLTCGEYQQIYRFSMQLCPCSVETEKGLRREIQKKIRQQPLEKSEITLPSDIAGIPLQWKKTGNMDGAMLSILGIVVCFLLPYGQKLEEQKQKKIILEKRKKDYPMLVEELSLFLAAGVTFTEAARKMTENYERRKKQTGKVQEGYELWKKLSYEMRDGVREADAIMRFGKESGRKEYKKLALLLEQNRRQGSQHMIQQLEQENLIAFEMRKNQVKREGEEASVKLLFPMMGMLGIVIVVLILPAMMTMKHL